MTNAQERAKGLWTRLTAYSPVQPILTDQQSIDLLEAFAAQVEAETWEKAGDKLDEIKNEKVFLDCRKQCFEFKVFCRQQAQRAKESA